MNGSDRELGELLRDGAWLRRFVATLVPRQDVDDVVQSTWLAALQGGTVTRSVRNWLCGAAANFARLLHRKTARGARAMREVARNAAHEPAAADLVEALEVQRLISEALLALPEPTRTILVLRYQQRLPIAAIAARVALQEPAVRQRLHRGRDAVRERLQQRFGDDWCACIAVVAFVRDHSVPTTAVPAWTLVLGGAAAAALTVVLLASTPIGSLPPPPLGSVDATAALAVENRAAAEVGASSDDAVVERVLVATAQEPAPASLRQASVRGRVVAAEHGRPLARVRVVANVRWGPDVPEADRTKIAPGVTGADGTFAILVPARASAIGIWFEAEGRSPREHDVDPPKAIELGDVPMRLGYEVKGRLLDEAGAPAAQARLVIPIPCSFPDDRTISFPCTTNERGEFAWKQPVPAGRVEIEFAGPDQQLIDGNVEVVAKAESNEFVLRCRRLPAISGVAFELDGTPCANLEIHAFAGPLDPTRMPDNQVGSCRTRADGSFTLHRDKGDSEQVDLRSSMLFAELNLFEPLPEVRWGTSGVRLQARPHADVELRVIDAEQRAPVERFVATHTFARGITRTSSGGGQPAPHAGGSERLGRLAHGTRILVWSADAGQAQVEIVVADTMRGHTVIEVALPRLQSFPCVIVDGDGKPLTGTFHVLDRNGTPAPQPWSDPRGGMTRTGTAWDAYRLHTVVTDRDGKGTILAPRDGRDLVLVRDGNEVRSWFPIVLPRAGESLRITVPY